VTHRITRILAVLGLTFVLPVISAEAAPVLIAEDSAGSGVAWPNSLAPAPGTIQFSYRIRTLPGGATTEYLTSSWDASTLVPLTFDLTGAALAATIAALQDGVFHDYQFWSFGPEQHSGAGPIKTVTQIFDTGFPDLTTATIGAVRISLFELCVSASATCVFSAFPNDIFQMVRMSIFSPDVTVPEPGAMALFAAGLSAFALLRRRQGGR